MVKCKCLSDQTVDFYSLQTIVCSSASNFALYIGDTWIAGCATISEPKYYTRSLSNDLSMFVFFPLLCRAMDSETMPIVPKKAPPMFSEPAQIQTVDTVEGLICTHEVCTLYS